MRTPQRNQERLGAEGKAGVLPAGCNGGRKRMRPDGDGSHPDYRDEGTCGRTFPWMVVVGLAALIWVIVRVVPKPSRAAYPCMRVSISLASTFLVSLAAVVASALSLGVVRKARHLPLWCVLPLATFVVALPLFLVGDSGNASTVFGTAAHEANQPIGVPKGIFPGRVVWIHDPDATNENCLPGSFGHGAIQWDRLPRRLPG